MQRSAHSSLDAECNVARRQLQPACLPSVAHDTRQALPLDRRGRHACCRGRWSTRHPRPGRHGGGCPRSAQPAPRRGLTRSHLKPRACARFSPSTYAPLDGGTVGRGFCAPNASLRQAQMMCASVTRPTKQPMNAPTTPHGNSRNQLMPTIATVGSAFETSWAVWRASGPYMVMRACRP